MAKNKFAVCVDPEEGLYLFINTSPGRNKRAAVPISPRELSCLHHDSYIDTSGLMYFESEDVKAQLENDRSRHKGTISSLVGDRIKHYAEKHNLLPPDHLKKLRQKL